MHIAFDVMGSDLGCGPAVLAAIDFIVNFKDVEITLVGNQNEINDLLISTNKKNLSNIHVLHAEEVISMQDGALSALRKTQSSMAKTIQLMKDQKVDGILSSGSTAAYIGACYAILGLIPHIKKPAFMPIMPTMIKDKEVLVLDVGANIENTCEELIGFAIMAHIYCHTIKSIARPSIALLNIGLEENKGPDLQKETYKVLSKLTHKDQALNFLNFRGNIEPRDVLSGQVDIVICNGYTGNIYLKTAEGSMKMILDLLKKEYRKNLFRKICGLLSRGVFTGVGTTFNYKNTGGAQLIGVNGHVFKAHGSSDKQSYMSTLRILHKAINLNVTGKIKAKIAEIQI